MKIARPFIVSDVSLVSSTVSAADPSALGAYAAGTTYALEYVVQVDSPTFTFTVAGAICTAAAHGFLNNTLCKVSTSGTLPGGLLASTLYYLVQPALSGNSFKLSRTKDGPPVITTGAGTGTHTVTVSSHKLYKSAQAANIGHTPHKSPTWWVEQETTNRWSVFDQSVTGQTQQADSMSYVIQTTGRLDTIALLNVNADEAVITTRESGGGVIVYGPTTYPLRASVSVASYWAWFFEPISRMVNFVDLDLNLAYANVQLTITLNDTGNTVRCGAIIAALSQDIGAAEFGAALSIADYSVKEVDDFGNYSVSERAFSKRGTFQVVVSRGMVDGLQKLLETYRATSVVYIGAPAETGFDIYESTIIYGFYKDFSIVIAGPIHSLCSIDIEGLT